MRCRGVGIGLLCFVAAGLPLHFSGSVGLGLKGGPVATIEAAPADPDGLEDAEESEDSQDRRTNKPQDTPRRDPAKHQEGLDLLRKRIQYSSSTDRRNAIRDVKRLKKEEQQPFYPMLSLFAKTDQDVAVREAAVRFLAEEGVDTTEAKEAFIAALDDTDRNVRLEALKGIRRTSLKEANEKLSKLILEAELNQNDAVLHAAIRTLGQLGYENQQLTDRLLRALDDPGTEMESRRSILLYAGSVRLEGMQAKLLKILGTTTEDLVMRAYSANALGKMASKDGGKATADEKQTIRKALQSALEEVRNIRDPRERTRFNALKQQCILALIRMGDDSVKGELRAGAQDDDANIRFRSVRYMGDLQLKEFTDLISYMAKHDESSRVRKEAERVLKGMGK